MKLLRKIGRDAGNRDHNQRANRQSLRMHKEQPRRASHQNREAGAFPGMARAVFAWIPLRERGLVKGVNFSASRLGAAVTMPLLPLLIDALGWKSSFVVLMATGFVWAAAWWLWFRDDPAAHPSITRAELDLIAAGRGPPPHPSRLRVGRSCRDARH